MRYLPGERENEIALRFDALLADIVDVAERILPEEELAAFRSYDFPGSQRRRLPPAKWRRQFRSLMRGEEWLVRHLLEQDHAFFAELGCGLGTWTFLAALCGAGTALGIDLGRHRLEAARIIAREVFPRHGRGEIRFMRCPFFRADFPEAVDVFYLKAALHHILPVEGLFDFMHRNLREKGVVVIHDINALHPYCQYRALRDRGLKRRKSVPDPDTGELIPYADEDFFTVPGILRVAGRHGFRTLYRQTYLGLRGWAGEGLYRRVVTPLNSSLVVGAFLAPTYQLVLQKT